MGLALGANSDWMNVRTWGSITAAAAPWAARNPMSVPVDWAAAIHMQAALYRRQADLTMVPSSKSMNAAAIITMRAAQGAFRAASASGEYGEEPDMRGSSI